MITQANLMGAASTVFYSLMGLALFVLSYKVLDWVTPFSLHKELADDQNTAVGIVVGSMMIGLSIIIAASIHG